MDKHEYEINQLINPKKDIVKSNSKHRDKIETLIQGRRIGGISEGGDTPEEILWAIEFESGKFAFGHANENQIFVATSGIGRQIWYADGSGVVEGYTESVDEITDTLIDTFNEHFGTNISHLTPDTELFNVGDTIPDWNAYEKIEIQLQKLAVHTATSTKFVIGYINESNEYVMYVFDSDTFPIIAESGEMDSVGNGLEGFKQYVILPTLQQSEYAINTIVNEIIPTMQVGDIVQDWNSYAKI